MNGTPDGCQHEKASTSAKFLGHREDADPLSFEEVNHVRDWLFTQTPLSSDDLSSAFRVEAREVIGKIQLG
jgi:hypothetical protein